MKTLPIADAAVLIPDDGSLMIGGFMVVEEGKQEVTVAGKD